MCRYGNYIKSVLKAGMRVRAIAGTRSGDSGSYVMTNGGTPPCQCRWDGYGDTFWVRAHDATVCASGRRWA